MAKKELTLFPGEQPLLNIHVDITEEPDANTRTFEVVFSTGEFGETLSRMRATVSRVRVVLENSVRMTRKTNSFTVDLESVPPTNEAVDSAIVKKLVEKTRMSLGDLAKLGIVFFAIEQGDKSKLDLLFEYERQVGETEEYKLAKRIISDIKELLNKELDGFLCSSQDDVT